MIFLFIHLTKHNRMQIIELGTNNKISTGIVYLHISYTTFCSITVIQSDCRTLVDLDMNTSKITEYKALFMLLMDLYSMFLSV